MKQWAKDNAALLGIIVFIAGLAVASAQSLYERVRNLEKDAAVLKIQVEAQQRSIEALWRRGR